MKDKMGGFGGLMKGLDSLMPKDNQEADTSTPKPRAVLNRKADTALNTLRAREHELHAQIGQMVVQQNGPDGFGDVSMQLREVMAQIQEEERKIREAEEARSREQQASKGNVCPHCGTQNAPGVNFCQECGNKLGAPAQIVCPQCGKESPPNTRFCGFCGTKLNA